MAAPTGKRPSSPLPLTSALIPFVREGIAKRDRCILLIEGNQFGVWKAALEKVRKSLEEWT